jgi:hypothetical protein
MEHENTGGTMSEERMWRRKPVVIAAAQWFKNGDHPEDGTEVHPTEGWRYEGKVVRYYRRPDVPGDRPCEQCHLPHDVHGWIDTLEQGHRVCPGDYIVTGIAGERYPVKPHIFTEIYEPAPPAVPPPAEQGDANLCVFCGSESIEAIPDHDEDGPMFYVYCGRCEAQGPVIYSVPSAGHKATPEEAIKAWNTRTRTPQPPAEQGEGCEMTVQRHLEIIKMVSDCDGSAPCPKCQAECALTHLPSSPASDARAEAHARFDEAINAYKNLWTKETPERRASFTARSMRIVAVLRPTRHSLRWTSPQPVRRSKRMKCPVCSHEVTNHYRGGCVECKFKCEFDEQEARDALITRLAEKVAALETAGEKEKRA